MKTNVGNWLFSKRSVFGLVACVLQSLAVAQGADGPYQSRLIETTLFAGRALGGSLENEDTGQILHIEPANAFGVALNIESSESDGFYEFSYFREDTSFGDVVPFKTSIEYLHVGGYTTFSSDPNRTATYFLLTVGGTRMTPEQSGFASATAASVAMGGGAKFPMSKHFVLRVDGRLYATFFSSDADLFCSMPGIGCAVHLKGNTLLRSVISLGAAYRF